MSRGEWDDLIVLCAANGWDTTKVVDQHMAEQLSATVPVLYVDPPISRLSVLRSPELRASLDGPRLRVIAPRLARLTPVVQPFPERRGSVTLTTAVLRRQLGRAAASLGGSVRALVSAWPMFPVLGACRERSRVYWAQDDFVGLAELYGTDGKLVDRREQQVAAAADIVVAANPLVAETWQSRGLDVRIIPFGCDADAYAHVDDLARPSDVRSEPPVVGFVGRINERIDPSLLEAIAARGRSLLFVGPRTPSFTSDRLDAVLERPNVSWTGPVPFDALPQYFAAIDVGVTPYGDSAFNRGSFPLKTLEYLAAGRAVVSTDLPATRWLDTDLVAVASGPEAFADAVDRALLAPQTPELVASRRAFAQSHSWPRRAADLLALLDELQALSGSAR
jgi:glycosyltransferase involved in cell wall biosynthesis